MIYTPHEYQTFASRFIVEHPASALILDMGLGKTVITLTAACQLLATGEVNKVLVVAPKRVAESTWPDEIRKWDHTKGLAFSLIAGSKKQRLKAVGKDAEVYIISRDNVEWLVSDTDFDFKDTLVVIDELSSFKSWRSKRFRAIMTVRPYITRIVGLTGTPSSNGLMDLFAEFKVIDGGERLGRYITRYREKYFVPDKRSRDVVFSYKPKPHAEEAIYDQISDITISMKADDYLTMPPLVTNSYPVAMSAKEQAIYDHMKSDMVVSLKDTTIDAVNAASLTGKLVQMANGAVYNEKDQPVVIHDHKLDALEDIIEAANGKSVMVAYWFRHDLERLKKRFPEARELKDTADFRDWNAGRVSVGLIHPASAGHGLNLQAGGSILVWFGLTWSLELYQQCNARLYRQGQKSTVVIEHIITKGTIDERVLSMLEKKEKTQDALINAVKAELEE